VTDTGESPAVEYVIDLDGDWADDWIAVPPVFPFDRWPDPEAWASDIAAMAFEKSRADRKWFRLVALELATDPPGDEDVDMVLWYAPLDGGRHDFVFLTIAAPDPELTDAEAWAVAGTDESETPVQVTRYPSEKFGEIAQSASTYRVDDQTVLGHICTVAVGQTAVFCLEATHTDFMLLARMKPGLVRLVDAMCELVGDEV